MHTLQERYAQLVDVKLRATLVKKDGVVFNTRYEGNPKAGAVKVPVRDTEVTAADYDKSTGAQLTQGATQYITVTISHDKAVNELIDGYEAAAVPDNLAADRLDSAGYSLALQIEQDATACLEAAATKMDSTAALTADTAYPMIVKARTALSKANVPNDGRRFLLVSPDVVELLLTDTTHFVRASQLGDSVVQTGAIGKIAGFLVFEDNTLSTTTDFIAGHPDWCCRINEWAVEPHLQNLDGSGTFIGASAVQGRKVYEHVVTKPKTLIIKTTASK